MSVAELAARLNIKMGEKDAATEKETEQDTNTATEEQPEADTTDSAGEDVSSGSDTDAGGKKKTSRAGKKKSETVEHTESGEKSSALTVGRNNIPAIQAIMESTSLIIMAPDDMTFGFVPIRYLKLEQKNPKTVGKITYGKDDNVVVFIDPDKEGQPALYPVIARAWRSLAALNADGKPDFTKKALCTALDGANGSCYGTCVDCPKRAECKKAVTIFFISSIKDDRFVYTFTLRDGWAMGSLHEVAGIVGWKTINHEFKDDNGYQFLIPHFKAVEGDAPSKERIEAAMGIVHTHLNK